MHIDYTDLQAVIRLAAHLASYHYVQYVVKYPTRPNYNITMQLGHALANGAVLVWSSNGKAMYHVSFTVFGVNGALLWHSPQPVVMSDLADIKPIILELARDYPTHRTIGVTIDFPTGAKHA